MLKTKFAFTLITLTSLVFVLPFAQASTPKCPLLFKKEKLCAELHWDKEPKAVEMPTEKDKAAFTIQFKSTVKSASGTFENADPTHDVSVGIFMPEMDHGSMPVKITHSDKGVYKIEDVYFTMTGAWEINVKLVDAKTHKIFDQAKIPYTLK
jgi:hypothetical protein